MSNKSMNFTGKCKLNDDEFLEYYEKLWKKTHNEKSLEPKIDEKRHEGEKRYNSKETYLSGEEWRKLPNYENYCISTMGRVKYKCEIVPQGETVKTGYLKLDVDKKLKTDKKLNIDHSVNVYTLVAKAFLGKEDGDGYEVHHIDNNGYDNRPENLILLTKTQHNAVHRAKKLSQEELAALFEQTEL